MRTKTFYVVLAYGTLIVDAYLALASVAIKSVPRRVYGYLPPFGYLGGSEASRILVLLVASWTAILALGCLRTSTERRGRSQFTAVLWFILVIAAIWLLLLVPLLAKAWWEFFVWVG